MSQANHPIKSKAIGLMSFANEREAPFYVLDGQKPETSKVKIEYLELVKHGKVVLDNTVHFSSFYLELATQHAADGGCVIFIDTQYKNKIFVQNRMSTVAASVSRLHEVAIMTNDKGMYKIDGTHLNKTLTECILSNRLIVVTAEEKTAISEIADAIYNLQLLEQDKKPIIPAMLFMEIDNNFQNRELATIIEQARSANVALMFKLNWPLNKDNELINCINQNTYIKFSVDRTANLIK